MSRLMTSLPLKVVAIFMCVIGAVVALLSGAGVAVAADEGYYDLTSANFYETSSGRNAVYNYAHNAIYLFVDHMMEYDGGETLTSGDVAYLVPGDSPYNDGAMLVKDYTDTSIANSTLAGYTIARADAPDDILMQQGTIDGDLMGIAYDVGYDDIHPIYRVTCYVQSTPVPGDWVYRDYRMFSLLYPLRYGLIAILVVSALFAVAAFVYLLCSVGHRRDRDGITPNALDRMPFDLYLFLAGLVVTLCLSFSFDGLLNNLSRIVISIIFLLVALLVVFATILTAATRFKAGGWWRNTVLYRLLRWLRRGWRRVWRGGRAIVVAVPVTWKVILGFIGVVIVELILHAFMSSYGIRAALATLLWIGFNVSLLGLLIFLAMGLQTLKKAGARLAEGNFDQRINRQWLVLDLRDHANNLESIGEGMQKAVEERMKSERLKTELITNVSHDLRTPLTSIVNYVDLLSQEKLPDNAAEYVEVLERQARRLTRLTEDLVEASKASSGNLQVTLERTDLCELVSQAAGEYQERLEAASLELVLTLPDEPLFIFADGRHLWRVMDNLLGNVCKYAQPDTRVYIDVQRDGAYAIATVKNTSRDRLGIDADELMERFVRGDSSRSTYGSGLGLNIARSLTELQQGALTLAIDGDLFKCELRFALHDVPSGEGLDDALRDAPAAPPPEAPVQQSPTSYPSA